MTYEELTAVQELAEQVSALAVAVHHLAEQQAALIRRIDDLSVEVQAYSANTDAYRAELMRNSLNGLRDTEPPPSSGPNDETPPHGRRTPIG